MSSELPSEPWQHAMARLLVAVRQDGGGGACPEPERLAALVDHRLSSQEVETLHAHFARCPPCYRRWSSLWEDLEQTANLHALPPPQAKPSIEGRFRRAGWTSLLTAAIAAMLILVIWPREPEDPLLRGEVLLQPLVGQLDPLASWSWAGVGVPGWRGPAPGGQSRGGGAALPVPDPSAAAFAAGARQGLAILNQDRGWQTARQVLPLWEELAPTLAPAGQDHWQAAMRAGHWAVLAHLACQAQVKPETGVYQFLEQSRPDIWKQLTHTRREDRLASHDSIFDQTFSPPDACPKVASLLQGMLGQ